MEKMNFNNTTLPEEEKRWTAFLNGELVDSGQSAADSQVRADFKAVGRKLVQPFAILQLTQMRPGLIYSRR
jgi:hypothetical protein